MTTHHTWCDKRRCTVDTQPLTSSGTHKGHVNPIRRRNGSTVATVWLEQVLGGVPLVALAHAPLARWTAAEAHAVAGALSAVAAVRDGLS